MQVSRLSPAVLVVAGVALVVLTIACSGKGDTASVAAPQAPALRSALSVTLSPGVVSTLPIGASTY